ncbi:hypothetical protein [Streptomyces sp. NPDC017991]|uniref:hypothetical protein n=1 Tax=Streptomyces sp. NPDC017991 TaxID=3365026 RepID=UPI0037B276AA
MPAVARWVLRDRDGRQRAAYLELLFALLYVYKATRLPHALLGDPSRTGARIGRHPHARRLAGPGPHDAADQLLRPHLFALAGLAALIPLGR